MRFELIHKDNYLLVVDESGSKVGQHYIFQNNHNSGILCHLPLKGAPVLDGVPLLPPLKKMIKLSYEDRIRWFVANYYETGMEYEVCLQTMKDIDLDNFEHYNVIVNIPKYVEANEDDVEQLAKQELPISEFGESIENKREWNGFKKGHQKAREKYKYTEKQLDDAISWATIKAREGDITHWDIDNFIQSLQQPMPIAFECEMEYIGGDIDDSDDYDERDWGVKTIINSEGRIEWVGKYIYE